MSTHDAVTTSRRTAEEFLFRDLDDAPNEELDDLDEVDEIQVELVVLALAGTTVVDDGLVERAYERALIRSGIATTADERIRALCFVRDNIGRAKADVFRELAVDADQAGRATSEFEGAFADLADREGIDAVPGAEAAIRRLRECGVRVALTTGLSRITMHGILEALGWEQLVDVVLCSEDVGRGRPYPDMALTALLRTRASSVEAMIVVGDTVSDIESGLAAGAGVTVGVLTGSHDEHALTQAGADVVIDSIADLPALLGVAADDAAASDDADALDADLLGADAADRFDG
ncbi:HAD family hydrolase [Rathayibacter sp. CAU 1779]